MIVEIVKQYNNKKVQNLTNSKILMVQNWLIHPSISIKISLNGER
jgi:hypothetical protein